jgi:hypothetical protein
MAVSVMLSDKLDEFIYKQHKFIYLIQCKNTFKKGAAKNYL